MTAPTSAQLLARLRTEGPQALRIVVAALVGWQICRWVDPTVLPIYAVIVPLVAMRADPYSAFNTSFDRLIGVVVGILIGLGVAVWLGPSLAAVALVLVVGLGVGIVLRVGPTLNLQVSLSALIVFANPDPASLAVSRLWETLVGAVVTVVLSPVLFPPDSRAAYSRAYADVWQRLGRQLSELSVLLEHAPTHTPALKAVQVASIETERLALAPPDQLAGAITSVHYNPLRRGQEPALTAMIEPTTLIGDLARDLRSMIDDVLEFSTRPDADTTWRQVGQPMARVVSTTAAAVSAGLFPDGLSPAGRLATATAADEVDAWRASARTPMDGVLRRPVYRLVHTLEALGERRRNDRK